MSDKLEKPEQFRKGGLQGGDENKFNDLKPAQFNECPRRTLNRDVFSRDCRKGILLSKSLVPFEATVPASEFGGNEGYYGDAETTEFNHLKPEQFNKCPHRELNRGVFSRDCPKETFHCKSLVPFVPPISISHFGANDESNGVKLLDANRYATKKTIAQGMLDIALLTANASQLKYILQVGKQHEFYTLMLTLICISIGLQILQCMIFIFLGSILNINKQQDQKQANLWNNFALLLLVLTVAINIVISVFEMRE